MPTFIGTHCQIAAEATQNPEESRYFGEVPIAFPLEWVRFEYWSFGKSMMLIFGGAVLGLLFARIFAGQVTFDEFLSVAGIVASSASAGMLSGHMEKPERLRTFAIAEHNERFLENLGFQELDGREVTHVDGQGNPLRLTEHNASRIVFMAVGRRNRRAYITLSPQGEMMNYSGIIPITEMR